MDELSLAALDAALMSARKTSRDVWPYTATGPAVRAIEAEYARRGERLPEERDDQPEARLP